MQTISGAIIPRPGFNRDWVNGLTNIIEFLKSMFFDQFIVFIVP